jgi:hypothetical protein
MHQIIERAVGAAKLDVATFEAVQRDRSATPAAALIVIVASIAASIGVAIAIGPVALLWTTVGAMVNWILWAALLWLIGTQIIPEPRTRTELGQMLRTLGFAASPGVLRIFVFIPLIGPIIAFIASLWMIATMVVAVRQALNYSSTLRAVGVCIVAWIVASFIIWLIFGAAGLGINAHTGFVV